MTYETTCWLGALKSALVMLIEQMKGKGTGFMELTKTKVTFPPFDIVVVATEVLHPHDSGTKRLQDSSCEVYRDIILI